MTARHSFDERLRRAGGLAFFALPEALRVLLPARNGYSRADVPPPVRAPEGSARLYIAPVNSAGQGWQWARAAERLEDVGAINMQLLGDRDLGYLADYAVAKAVVAHSRAWGHGQFEAVSSGFTHVLAESHLPLFGRRFKGDVVRERRELEAAGLRIASLSHGSDIRLPSRHGAYEPWSPFRDGDPELRRALECTVTQRAALLDQIDGMEFVSTPDLLLDRPRATWLPIVVQPDRWTTDREPLEAGAPVVLHAPSSAVLKGTALIMGVLETMSSAGVIQLVAPSRTAAAEMPQLVRSVDVVADQFSLGSYGVAAVEAMAAGRVVVSHVSPTVRDFVRANTGMELPIVEADANNLPQVLQDIRARPDHYREVARQGVAFARAVHDGRRSARVLEAFLMSSRSMGE